MDEKDTKPTIKDDTVATNMTQPTQLPRRNNKKAVLIVLTVSLLIIAALLLFLITRDSKTKTSDNSSKNTVSSFEECVAAGNAVRETYPEQCVADGQTFSRSEDKSVNSATDNNASTNNSASDTAKDPSDPYCKTGETLFSNKSFGARFCYPVGWGTASVMDARIDTTDTGHREAVRFSANTKFIVGGVSDDWTTTVGRDVSCQEPNNTPLELSSYDTEWNNITGTGMDIEFAQRSLPSSIGGYDMEETVSNILNSGVCAQGHKVINGSRYRVVSAAYYIDFSTASGILTPKAHIDSPFVLFSTSERQQFDRLLATVEAL